MLTWAVKECRGPVAVRYPRGGEGAYRGSFDGQRTVTLQSGKDLTLVTYGASTDAVLEAAEALKTQGINAEVVKLQSIAPADWTPVLDSARTTGRVLVVEECVRQGGVGQQLAAQLALAGIQTKKLLLLNVGGGFVTHGSVGQLRGLCGLDAEGILQKAKEALAP